MATSKVLTNHSVRTPSDLPQILLAVALWVVLLAVMALLVGAGVTWVITTFGNTAYLQGQGVGAALPLGSLAAFMTFSWLPAFMPLIVPLAAVVLLLLLPWSGLARRGYHQFLKAWEA